MLRMDWWGDRGVGFQRRPISLGKRDCVATGVAAPRLSSIFHFTRRSRAGLTALPPLRGWFDRLSGGLSRLKILRPFATQSLKPPDFSGRLSARKSRALIHYQTQS